ncbi:hypothetical protein [Aestuariicoccus sp. MJ-SS9]|uniref:hypothetical protein n=1 Tax=Aestuariicoccus sp. MJ-SS9 TaxID=3079855 RepID=UPI002914BE9B|nr:hypothetical protein [Aestuariicoccus sp. MJ-SS9]MDU8911804.1 hypothetical protein [Aestuariicoccus sp. MJ-SS9]
MTRFIFGLLALICAATSAGAGAWQRPEGQGFASATARLSWPQEFRRYGELTPSGQYYTLYLEYGLTGRLTAGLDLGRAVSGAAKTVGFVQWPLRDRDSGLKVAGAFGLGQIDGHAVMRPGLSLGLGLARGWLTADSFAEVRLGTYETDFKIDLTWGRNLASDRKLILQVQTGAPHDAEAFVRLAPSMVFPLRDRVMFEAGGALGLVGDDSFGILLGVWTEF